MCWLTRPMLKNNLRLPSLRDRGLDPIGRKVRLRLDVNNAYFGKRKEIIPQHLHCWLFDQV